MIVIISYTLIQFTVRYRFIISLMHVTTNHTLNKPVEKIKTVITDIVNIVDIMTKEFTLVYT